MDYASLAKLFSVPHVLLFMLMLTRVSGMVIASPLLSHHSVPPQVKIGLSMTLVLVLFAQMSTTHVPLMAHDVLGLGVLAVKELAIGLLLGFTAQLVFTGIQMAGDLISAQMGLSVANVLDPASYTQMPVMAELYFLFGLLLFLNLNVHHALIVGIGKTFAVVPVGADVPNLDMMLEKLWVLCRTMFLTGLLIALPVIGFLLVTEAAMAIVSKVMPQMNIFMVGIPLKVTVGLLVMLTVLPFTQQFLSARYSDLTEQLLGLYGYGFR